MNVVDKFSDLYNKNPANMQRIIVAILILGVGLPGFLYYLSTVEQKAYTHLTSGYYAYRAGDFRNSRLQLGQLMNLYPNSKYAPLAYYYAALAHSPINKNNSAKYLQTFIDKYDDNPLREKVYPLLIGMYVDINKPDKGLKLVGQYMNEYGDKGNYYDEVNYKGAIIYLSKGQSKQANDLLEKAAKSNTGVYSSLATFALTSASNS